MIDRPPTIVLLAAVQAELEPTIGALGLRRRKDTAVGESAGHRLIAGTSGIGRDRVLAAANQLLGQTANPALMIHLGFAGGLDPHLSEGEVLRFGTVINEAGDAVSLDPPVEGSTLLTVDRLADTVDRKRELFSEHGAAAVDMETYHLAKYLAARGMPMIAIRAISDPADRAAPAEAVHWTKADGSVDAPAVARHMVTRPWRVPAILNLGQTARLAGARLAEAVRDVVDGLDLGPT